MSWIPQCGRKHDVTKTLNENQNTLPTNLKREIGSGKVKSSSGHNFYRLSKVPDIVLLDSVRPRAVAPAIFDATSA